MAKQPHPASVAPDGIGVRIRTRAAYLGITISAVAERAGMHRQHLNSISRGYKDRKPSNPTRETKNKLAGALEVPIDYFDMSCCIFCGNDWRRIATMPAQEIEQMQEETAVAA